MSTTLDPASVPFAASAHASASEPDTIVLIHGLWMTPRSWDGWVDRYIRAGYDVLTPTYPGMDASVEELRHDPSPIAALSIPVIVGHLESLIRGLDKPPIIIGHSFGGTFVQLLLDRGLATAGVALASAPTKGVDRLPASTLRSTLPLLRNPLNARRAVPLSERQFHYAFTNTLTREESDAVYARQHVPAPGRVLFQGALAGLARHAATAVDYRNDLRAPLLFVAGGEDHVIPPSVNRANARRYRHAESVTAFRELPGRSHYVVGQEGWEEVADLALEWALAPSPDVG